MRPLRQIRDWARIVRRAKREEIARATDARSVYFDFDHQTSRCSVNVETSSADGMTLKTAIDHLAKNAGPGPDGEWGSLAQRRADALVELAKRHLATLEADRATVVIHCTPREIARADGFAKFQLGPLVPSEVARRLSCDGWVETVIHGPDGAVGIGRRSRIVPAKLERELRIRDDGCVLCGNRNALHTHHVQHWVSGGKTDLDNLVTLCWKCHRLVHDQCFSLTRNQFGQPLLIRPDGRPVPRQQEPLRQKYRERILGPPVPVG